jgi:hypothetical protein
MCVCVYRPYDGPISRLRRPTKCLKDKLNIRKYMESLRNGRTAYRLLCLTSMRIRNKAWGQARPRHSLELFTGWWSKPGIDFMLLHLTQFYFLIRPPPPLSHLSCQYNLLIIVSPIHELLITLDQGAWFSVPTHPVLMRPIKVQSFYSGCIFQKNIHAEAVEL